MSYIAQPYRSHQAAYFRSPERTERTRYGTDHLLYLSTSPFGLIIEEHGEVSLGRDRVRDQRRFLRGVSQSVLELRRPSIVPSLDSRYARRP